MEWSPERRECITRFHDGAEAYATPHDTADYHQHALEKSTGSVDLYCWQHDLAHVIVALMHGYRPSAVLWALAHNEPTDTIECETEEIAAQSFQKAFFLRC